MLNEFYFSFYLSQCLSKGKKKVKTVPLDLSLLTPLADGLQSIPQWESAFNFPSGGKVRGLLLAFFDNINKNLSWDC